MIDVKKCNECQKQASVHVSWPTSKGVQSGFFCEVHAGTFWSTYKHTPAGQGAIFTSIQASK